MAKLVWRVQPAPTGKYRSFQKRGWPTACYKGTETPAAFLWCEDDYHPARVREGQHREITITVLHHNHPENPRSWKQFALKAKSETLEGAKMLAQQFLDVHPTFHPRKPVPLCDICNKHPAVTLTQVHGIDTQVCASCQGGDAP